MKDKQQLTEHATKLEQELAELKATIAAIPNEPSYEPRLPKDREKVFKLYPDGDIRALHYASALYDAYCQGNVFKTFEEAELERDIRAATHKVKNRIKVLNEGWKPDYSDEHQKKYTMYFNHTRNTFYTDYWYVVQYSQSDLYLYLKSRELVFQLIKEMPNELKLVITGER